MSRVTFASALILAVGYWGTPPAAGQCQANELDKLTVSAEGEFDAFGLALAIDGDISVIAAIAATASRSHSRRSTTGARAGPPRHG